MSSARLPPPANDRFETAIHDAQSDIARSVEKAGLQDDPIRYPLAALSGVVGLFPEFLREMRDVAQDGRQPLDAAALDRLEKAAAKGASRASSDLVRAHYRRSVLLGSFAVAAAVVVSVGGGYWWGRSAAISQFRIADTGFAAMVHENPTNATGWLAIASLNDYAKTMAACQDMPTVSGRHACLAPLWRDDGNPTAPPQAPTPSTKTPAP